MAREISPDTPLEEGEIYQNVFLIEPHDFVPFPDLVAKLTGAGIGLQAEIDAHTDLIGTKTTILDKELIKKGEREFHYIVTYRVDHVADVEITAGAYGKIMAGIIASIILAIAVSVTLIQVRKTAKETPLALLGLGYIVLKGFETVDKNRD